MKPNNEKIGNMFYKERKIGVIGHIVIIALAMLWLISSLFLGIYSIFLLILLPIIIGSVCIYQDHQIFKKYNPIKIGKDYFHTWETASHEVDPENGFTPLCPNELPVPEGHMIVNELNAQSALASIRTCSKDMHNPHALNIANEQNPQFSRITGHPDLDMYWNSHCQSGTFGSQLISGLPRVTSYHFVAYKGMESDMHPYGACYHDLAKTLSTGLIEFYRQHGIKLIIVGGLATDYCLKETVIELLNAGFKVIVNLGASRGIAPDSTDNAVRLMRASGAVIVNSTDEIRAMRYSNER